MKRRNFSENSGSRSASFRKFPQPRDLACPPGPVSAGGRVTFALYSPTALRDPEPFGQNVDQRGINIVDALAIGRQNRILWGGGFGQRLRFPAAWPA